MTEQITKILAELKVIQAKLPEIRDLFWLEIDRYDETDCQRGEAFDEKFARQTTNLVRAINSFTAFVEKSFTPSAEELARKEAIQKLRAEFPGFDNWNAEAKNALIKREMNTLLQSPVKLATNTLWVSKHKIKDELRNTTILNGDNFSDDFLEFYNSLDPTNSTYGNQKFLVRKYLLKQGYDENLVNSLKSAAQRSAPSRLLVTFSDGTQINDKNAASTLVKTIQKIGLENVVALNMPFISQNKDLFRAAASIGNGYFVKTHSSTNEKRQQLENISQRLNLNLIIEIVKG